MSNRIIMRALALFFFFALALPAVGTFRLFAEPVTGEGQSDRISVSSAAASVAYRESNLFRANVNLCGALEPIQVGMDCPEHVQEAANEDAEEACGDDAYYMVWEVSCVLLDIHGVRFWLYRAEATCVYAH